VARAFQLSFRNQELPYIPGHRVRTRSTTTPHLARPGDFLFEKVAQAADSLPAHWSPAALTHLIGTSVFGL